MDRLAGFRRLAFVAGLLLVLALGVGANAQPAAPVPLLMPGHSVDWWFVFKFNAQTAPTTPHDLGQPCAFGGSYQRYKSPIAQHYEAASSENSTFALSGDLLGESDSDPVGATFSEIYNGDYSYVVWNDQFYEDPPVAGCGTDCNAPWAHSKGLLAWDDQGNGVVMQVTTPSWPASGSARSPRQTIGNTLGCIDGDNDVLVSQDFFALKLREADVASVLKSLANAGVVTLPNNDQVVHLRGAGPQELMDLASKLGDKNPAGAQLLKTTLSSGVELISKPAVLQVPPWQLVSAALGGEPLRVANWWGGMDKIPSTNGTPGCWDPSLGPPGRVEIATTGTGPNGPIGLEGLATPRGNHAKIGVSLPGGHGYTIFGDMNQDGGLASACDKSQDARGGLFFVLSDPQLYGSVSALLAGDTVPDGTQTPREQGRR